MPELALWVILGLIVAIGLAGMVRGFAGFGDALVFLPIGGALIDPVVAIGLFMLIGVPGPMPLLPEAFRNADRKILFFVIAAMLLTLPIGFALLTMMSQDVARALVSSLAMASALLMVSGWKPHIAITSGSLIALGVLCGLVGGASGVPGALLLFFFLNTALRARHIRANLTIILWVFDIAMLIAIVATIGFDWRYLALAALMLASYLIGGQIGHRLFDPEKERLFRAIGLAAIFLSGVVGFPYGLLA